MPAQIAPWIQIVSTATGSDVLGPGLARYALSLPLEDGQQLPEDGAHALLALGLAWTPPETIPPMVAPPTAGLVLAPGVLAAGQRLAAALAEITGAPWRAAEAPLPEGSPAQTIYIGPLEPAELTEQLAPLLRHGPVLWAGEALEGPHLGPVLRTAEDVADYVEASRAWAHVAALEAAGFPQLPCSVAAQVVAAPDRVATLALHLLAENDDLCWLLDEDRPVRLWTSTRRRPQSPTTLDAQRWSKGFLFELQVSPFGEDGELFCGTCRTPHDRVESLEDNGGKGSSPDEARRTTIGEAVERLSAWMANRALPVLDRPLDYRLESFHPWGPPYDTWRAAGSPALPGVAARDELSGANAVVPMCLVPFSYVPGDPARIATACDTAGLAAYPTREGAVLRATLELLERHDLYPHLRQLRPGRRLAPATLPTTGPLAARLEAQGLRPWLLRFDAPLPVVHAFLLDPATGILSRGTGSGNGEDEAARKALIESLQIRALHTLLREQAEEIEPGYAAFGRPEVVERLTAWIVAMPIAEADARVHWRDDAEGLATVLRALAASGRTLLVVDLPCPVDGWHAVRALVPGLSTHQHPSNSDGGRAMLDAAFAEPVPV